MPAPHKSTVYPVVDIPNPFTEGQDRAYADILRDKINETRWWRTIVGTGVLVLFAVSIGLFRYALSTQKTVPVLVNVMPSGETQFLGEVRQNGPVPVPEAAVVYQVRTFIVNLRSVSTDRDVLFANIEHCYAMVTSGFSPIMTRSLQASSPFDLVGKVRRSVQIESIINSTARTYQIDWIETVTDSSASRKNTRMRALVTVRLLAVTDATIRQNPLGIYIENCEMTEL